MLLDRLDRYIARNVLLAMLVVQVLILGLDLMITYINDLGDVEGDYGALEVLLYLLMRLPSRFYEFVPVGVLLGALIGLGSMASSNELTIMRAAGRSLTRILWGVMKPLGLVIVITMAVGEYVAPVTEMQADAWRAEQQQGAGAVYAEGGGWQREGNNFYRFGSIRSDDVVLNVTRYQFDDDQELKQAMYARRAVWEDDHWTLEAVETTVFEREGGEVASTRVEQQDSRQWDTRLTPDLLKLVITEPKQQSASDLWRYASYLKGQGLSANQPLLYFWQKILQPLTLAALVLVAASFVFGPLRTVAAGTRVFYGIIVGLLFKYLQDLLAPASVVFGFAPIWAVLAPTIACYVIGLLLIRRSG
ncbi:LPS export ABC transporter permease LptG [Cobetia sp. 5-11-6-3]|uniref:LPS export ABC transporter permease LptG n=1 Tax=Cobetia sp. 5-11-6-3 TaxID=2737458 RepID=UPI0015966D01|nr:LPS export ABC transporter permease LptG [Cobetia sp. 5-11-6-3]